MLRLIRTLFPSLAPGLVESVDKPLIHDRWRCHALDKHGITPFSAQWDALNRRLTDAHPLLDSRFVQTLLKHFGDGSERLWQLTKDGLTTGLSILKPAKPGVWTTFLPAQAPIAPILITAASGLGALFTDLPTLAWQLDVLCQDPDFSPLFQTCCLPVKRMQHALTMNIRLDGDFEAYWDSRTKNLRSAMRTRDNRLAKAGLVPRLDCLKSPDEMRGAVERFGHLESAGWKGRAGTAVSPDNIQGNFYTDVLETFARTGQATAYEYWLGEHLAASQLTIDNGKMVVMLKTSYDEELANYSPGRLLQREVIRDCFERHPGGVMEFYTNANSDALSWATGQRWIEHVSIYRNDSVKRLTAALQSARSLGESRCH